jgi:hypothetical protein
VASPESATWTEATAIGDVLGELARSGATCLCAPDGRQATLGAASPGDEAATIELATDGARYLLRPERLALEAFEGHAVTYLRLSTSHLDPVNDAAPLALAEHRRVRVRSGSAFVLFAAASPLVRAAVDRHYATWSPERLREFVGALQETMLGETR